MYDKGRLQAEAARGVALALPGWYRRCCLNGLGEHGRICCRHTQTTWERRGASLGPLVLPFPAGKHTNSMSAECRGDLEKIPPMKRTLMRARQDLLVADAIILGAPGRQGGMCGEMRLFLDSLAHLQVAGMGPSIGKLKAR